MTINAPRGAPAAALRARRRGAGRRADGAARHGPERRAQGVRRARQLHLPARAVDAADDRPLRVLRRERAEVEHDLDLRLPHARGGLLGGAGGRLHARQRHRLRRRRRSTPGSPSTTSARASRSSSTATTTSSRRSRSSAPPGGCGRRSCASASAPTDPNVAAAALPHADRRGHAARPAAGEQHRPRGAPGASPRSAAAPSRCTPTASTRRSRCRPSARRGSPCAPSRCSPTKSGAADTVDPFAGSYFVEALTDELEQRAWELIGQVDELGGSVEARSSSSSSEIEESALPLPGALPHRPGRHRRRQQVRRATEVEVADLLQRRSRVREAPGRAAQGVQGQPRPGGSSSGGSRSCARPPAATRTCCPRSRRPCATAASMGEVCDAMRDVFGEYRGGAFF